MPTDSQLLSKVRDTRRALAKITGPYERAEGDFERVSIPATDADVLRDLLIGERPRLVIEIGLGYGSSALAIAEALLVCGRQGAKHVIIDAYQGRFGNAGYEAITGAGLADLCSLLPERSQLALPRLVADGYAADAAFVDGSHSFHNVFVDLYFLRELIRPGGLVIVDDCQWTSVATAVRYFELNAGWQRAATPAPTRLAAFRLPDARTEPRFEAFKSFAIESST